MSASPVEFEFPPGTEVKWNTVEDRPPEGWDKDIIWAILPNGFQVDMDEGGDPKDKWDPPYYHIGIVMPSDWAHWKDVVGMRVYTIPHLQAVTKALAAIEWEKITERPKPEEDE